MLESILIYSLLAIVMIISGREISHYQLMRRGGDVFFLYLIPILAFTFVFGCRYDVGIDYLHYLWGYLWGSERESEPVFRYITKTMYEAGIHYSIYFSLWALIQISLIYYSLRRYPFIFPYMAFFLIYGMFFMSMMNVMRQQLAACVFMASLQFIEEKKWIKYILCIFVATIFHRSALLLLLVYPFFVWRDDWFKNVKIQILLYSVSLLISIFFKDIFISILESPFTFFTEVTGYDDTYRYSQLEIDSINSRSQFGNNTGLGIYVYIFLSLPVILLSKKMKKFYNCFFFNMTYTLYFVSVIADFLFSSSIILYRPFVYVVNFKMVMLSFFAIFCTKHKSGLYKMLLYGFILMYFAKFINMLSNGEINKTRYLFFWDVQL